MIDEAPSGWESLGTDLLDGAPQALRDPLIGDDPHPSVKLDNVIDTDGNPVDLGLFTEQSAGDLEWAYVLRPHGVEVIALSEYSEGPVVDWNTDPRSRIIDYPQLWTPDGPSPVTAPPRATSLTATALTTAPAPTPARTAARRN